MESIFAAEILLAFSPNPKLYPDSIANVVIAASGGRPTTYGGTGRAPGARPVGSTVPAAMIPAPRGVAAGP